MNQTEWVESLPEKPTTDRDKKVLEAIEMGLVECPWSEIISTINGHTAKFWVNTDACHVILDQDLTFKNHKGLVEILPAGSRFRFQVTARLNQQCADALDASMVTPKIMDLSYLQAEKQVDCITLPPTAQMSSMTWSKSYNLLVEKKRDGEEGIFQSWGKIWCLDNKLKFSKGSINHGFFSKSASQCQHGIKMYQCRGGAHDASHQDYSQVLFLMKKNCEVDGQEASIYDLMKDPKLSYLLNYDGILNYTKQP